MVLPSSTTTHPPALSVSPSLHPPFSTMTACSISFRVSLLRRRYVLAQQARALDHSAVGAGMGRHKVGTRCWCHDMDCQVAYGTSDPEIWTDWKTFGDGV
ncbi:UNVERIFIED_CONTAM: hypothetical protein Sindi_2100100 [Sesamum indicum]